MLLRNSSIRFGYRYSTEVFLNERFNTSGPRLTATSQVTKQLYISLSYRYGKKIRYIVNPYQGTGNDVSAVITFLPSEKLHLDLSLTYSDFVRDSDSANEYDYAIIRGKTTYQVNKYLFFRGIVDYNSFRKRLTTDLLASFTYIPGTVIHIGSAPCTKKSGGKLTSMWIPTGFWKLNGDSSLRLHSCGGCSCAIRGLHRPGLQRSSL